MKFTNFKISRESIFPIENVAHVRSRVKLFIIYLYTFEIPDFVRFQFSKPRKPVFIFITGPTTIICNIARKSQGKSVSSYHLMDINDLGAMTMSSVV